MKIGTVAKKSGVSAKNIRYYESIGLVSKASRGSNGYRTYSDNDVETLRFIRSARNLGFSIENVSNLLSLWHDNNRSSTDVKALALKHIDEIEVRISELQSIRDTLSNLTQSCHGDDRPECPILEGLARGADSGADQPHGLPRKW